MVSKIVFITALAAVPERLDEPSTIEFSPNARPVFEVHVPDASNRSPYCYNRSQLLVSNAGTNCKSSRN